MGVFPRLCTERRLIDISMSIGIWTTRCTSNSVSQDFEKEAIIVASRFRDREYPATAIQRGRGRHRFLRHTLRRVSATSIPGAIKTFYKDLRASQHVTKRLRIVGTHPFSNPETLTGFKVGDNLGSALGATLKKKNRYS